MFAPLRARLLRADFPCPQSQVTYFVGEKTGRRWTIWLAMGVVIVGTTLQISSYTVPHLIIGRIITGIGTGMKTSTVPM